jgi:hypothetical protein
MDMLDWWQAVLDETKDFVDDGIDRLRDRPEGRYGSEVDELRRQLAELSASVDAMISPGDGRPPKSSSR